MLNFRSTFLPSENHPAPTLTGDMGVFVDGPAVLTFSKSGETQVKVNVIGGRADRFERLHLDPSRAAKQKPFKEILDSSEREQAIGHFLANNRGDWSRIKSITKNSAETPETRETDLALVESLFRSVNPNTNWDEIPAKDLAA